MPVDDTKKRLDLFMKEVSKFIVMDWEKKFLDKRVSVAPEP
jgi:hypothetical protein